MTHSTSTAQDRRRWLEFFLLFVLAPVGLFFIRDHFTRWIVPTLVVTAFLCLAVLLRDPLFERRRLGFGAQPWRALGPILLRFVPGALLLSAAVAVFQPELLFAFPRREPLWWAVIMVAYPLLSVYPQEVLFRTFFFHRYRRILKTQTGAVLWSTFVFGLAHLFFANWMAPTLTAVGGYLFARTYIRTESTGLASVEHALWGDFLFTVGLGVYFWGGSIRAMVDVAGP